MPKFISYQEAASMIPDGATVMFGGFMGCGAAHNVLAELARLGTKDLTMITDDTAFPNGPNGSDFYGHAVLIHNRQVKKFIGTHVGLLPDMQQQMRENSIETCLLPMGSFVEMVRAGGAGLGAIVTPTGVGTLVEENEFVHSKTEIDGRTYLVMKPLKADFALISGYNIDKAGNIWYKGTTRNFSHYMAMAADVVIAEAENVVEIGTIEPENVMTPGILIDYVASGKEA